ncbi:hypothetical protein EUZ93_01825 [Wolbachia pipientis]|nr:hypothetical protein [Wolbachia pipientis]
MGVSDYVKGEDNHVSSDDKRRQDSIQSAECVEQMDDRQVSLNQDNSQLAGNQQEQLGSEGEEVNGDSSQQVEIRENNNKCYDHLLELLNAIEGNSDLNERNVIETI